MHRLCRACEAGDDQDAGVVHLGRDELLGDQVHAVSKRRDECDLRIPIHRGKSIRWDRAVEIANGGPSCGRKSAVDTTDELVDLALESLVLSHLPPARDGQLEQRHLFSVLGMKLE